ncbi:MAG: DUF58 domain-containing protein [Oscillospiraceae bacterium]|nr:DUF58 domain-containing protein [Oscillospiraceae bacterium]
MIRNKLLYLVLLIVLVLFFILYRGILSLELLIFALLLPVLLWVMLLLLRNSLRVRLRHSKGPIRKGDSYQWILHVKNNSPFPSPYAIAELEYRCSLGGEPQPLKLRVPVLACNTGRVRLSFHAVVCGAMELRVLNLTVFDPLRIFHRTIPLDLTNCIMIAPDSELNLPEDWAPDLQMDDDAVEFSKEKPGDDPSEIFDLHEYRAGDSVSRIHWKLSSKLDELMVKEYSLPLASAYRMVCDFRYVGTQPDAALRLDAMLSAMQRFSEELTMRGVGHQFVMFDPDIGCTESATLTEEGDAEAWMQTILTRRPLPETMRDSFLTNILDYFTEGHLGDKVAFFLPKADEAMLAELSALPKPERFLVIVSAKASESKQIAEMQMPFEIIPAEVRTLNSEPVFLMNDPGEDEDEEDYEEAEA